MGQPQQTSSQATGAALGQAQVKPTKPEGVPSPDKFSGQQQSDPNIMKNLETHLNQLPPAQKTFLVGSLQHYSNIVIPVLGIVCGQEVFQYFLNIYKQNFQKNAEATGQQQPSQPQGPQGPQGAQPTQQAPLPQSVPHPASGPTNSALPAPNAAPAAQSPQ